ALVLAREADVGPRLHGAEDAHAPLGGGDSGPLLAAPAAEPAAVRVLVRRHRIGPGRQRRAREHAVGLSTPHRPPGGAPARPPPPARRPAPPPPRGGPGPRPLPAACALLPPLW